jgi:hypothetical protein
MTSVAMLYLLVLGVAECRVGVLSPIDPTWLRKRVHLPLIITSPEGRMDATAITVV